MSRAPRDPEGRRRAIVEAAAELIFEIGISGVTHRKIAERAEVPLGSTTQYFDTLDDLLAAAVAQLSASFDDQLAELEHDLQRVADRPEVLARSLAGFLVGYLSDSSRVRIEAGLYVSQAENPLFRSVVDHWYSGFTALLARFMPERSARAVVIFIDGVLLQIAQLQSDLPDEGELAWSLGRLMGESDA